MLTGNDRDHLRDAMQKALNAKKQRNGGLRFVMEVPTIGLDLRFDLQPGRLTFKQRGRIRSETGKSVEEWLSEFVRSLTSDRVAVSADAVAAVIYAGLTCAGERVTVEEAEALAESVEDATVLEIVELDGDGNPVDPNDSVDVEPVAEVESVRSDSALDVNDPEAYAPV